MSKFDTDELTMALRDLNFKSFLDIAAKNRNKKDSYTFHSFFKHCSLNHYVSTIEHLNNMLMGCLEKYLGCPNNGKGTFDKEVWTEAGQLFQAAVDLGSVSFQLNYAPSAQIMKLAVFLNGIILQVPQNLDNVKNNIAHFCEKLSATPSITKSQYFLFNVLIYLLQRTLGKKSLKTDVKRIYNIRKSLPDIIVLKEANVTEIWTLFKKCFTSHLYLNMLEGQKILTSVMVLDIDQICNIHKIIKPQLNSCNLETAASYGKIYFEAWSYCFKNKETEMKNVIEISCIQEYILSAIHTNKKSFIATVRKLLKQFRLHKKDFDVAKMLHSLYQPILWRYLKNPDGLIRANATQLFLDEFPLEDPEITVAASNQELNDQLLMIQDLLTDGFPIVRCTTIIGLCCQMCVSWEIFPEDMLKTYFRIFVDKLSCDSASAEVRCAVARGLKVLMENPLTIPTLQNILPKLAGLFHDISENVRIAFCHSLLRVKSISAIKYFEIIPLDHLLARLEEDCTPVKKTIVSLIFNSYFPRNEDPKVWLGRCLMLMVPKYRKAAREFFVLAGKHLGVVNSVKFITVAVKAIHLYVKAKMTTSKLNTYVEPTGRKSIGTTPKSSGKNQVVGFDDINVVKITIECLAILWLSCKIDEEKPEHKKNMKMLVVKAGPPLVELYHFYKDSPAWEAVFYISSFLPVSIVPSLASLCFYKLKSLPLDAKPADYMTLLECLCNQHQTVELLALLKEWIEAGLNESFNFSPRAPKKRRSNSGRNSVSQNFNVPKPHLANEMMNQIFAHRVLQKSILSHDESLNKMLDSIDCIKRKFEKNCIQDIDEKEAAFLNLFLFNITRLSVFLHDERDEGSIRFITDLVLWTENKLLKQIEQKKATELNNLLSTYLKNLCDILADVTALGYCDSDRDIFLTFFETILNSWYRNKYALVTAKFLYKYAVCAQYVYLETTDSAMIQQLLNHLVPILNGFNHEELLKQNSPNDLKEIHLILSNVMHVVHNHITLFPKDTAEAFIYIIKSIIMGLMDEAEQRAKELDDEPFSSIPFPVRSSFFFSVMNMKSKLIPLYVKYLAVFYKSEKQSIPLWIATSAVLKSLFDSKNMTKACLKETGVLIKCMEKTLHEIYPEAKDDKSTPETENNTELLEFQKHCHKEFLMLKCQYSKMSGTKKNLQ